MLEYDDRSCSWPCRTCEPEIKFCSVCDDPYDSSDDEDVQEHRHD